MVKNFTKFYVVFACTGFIPFITGLLQLGVIAELLRILLFVKTETLADLDVSRYIQKLFVVPQ